MFSARVVTMVAISAAVMGAGSPAVAQGVCGPGSFELPIFTAGIGESLVAALPEPFPRPAIALRFAQIASGILELRTDVFWGRDQAARARQEQLLELIALNSRSIERLAALPEPFPEPPAALLNQLMQISADLFAQVADLPVPIP